MKNILIISIAVLIAGVSIGTISAQSSYEIPSEVKVRILVEEKLFTTNC